MRDTWSGDSKVVLTNAISSITRCARLATRAGSHVQSMRIRYSGVGNLPVSDVAVMLYVPPNSSRIASLKRD